MSFGFTKTFRLVALVLLVSVMQVYVMAHPGGTNTILASKNTESASKPVVTDHQLNFIKQNQVTSQTQLASERSITFAPKSPLSLAFTKATLEKAASKTAFLNIKTGKYEMMKSPRRMNAAPADDDSSDDGGISKKTVAIASAIVIGAAVALFIGFRSDRDDDNVRGN